MEIIDSSQNLAFCITRKLVLCYLVVDKDTKGVLLCTSRDWWHTMVILGRVSSFSFPSFISILTYHCCFQVHHYSSWHMLPSECFIEKCGERVIIVGFMVQILEGAVWLNAVLQAEEFPACISYLNSSLANMDRDALTLRGESRDRVRKNTARKSSLFLTVTFSHHIALPENSELLLSAIDLVVQPRDHNETMHIHTRCCDSS